MLPRQVPPSTSPLWPALILLVFTVTALAAVRTKGPTADELKFLRVGQYLTTEWDWEPASTTVHAPLSFYTHGLLLKPFTFSGERSRLFWARAVMLVYAWGLGLAVYTWARTAHGARAGLLALVLWAALPDTLAHAPLITTDVVFACWVTWLGFALWRWSATGRWPWALAGGAALGLALLSKYSAALWVPVLVVLGVLLAFVRRGSDAPPPRRVFAGVGVMLCVGYVLLCVGYGGVGMLDTWGAHPWASDRLVRWATWPLAVRLPLLAPLAWWQGIDYQSTVAELGHPGFLLGRRFLAAPWYFLPVAFLYKVPTPFLVLLALAPWATRRVPRRDWRETACLLAPPLALAVYLMFFNRIAAGFRYIYPLLPALCILLGRYAAPDARMLPQVRNAVRVLVVLCVAVAVWHFPNYLASINLFAGGANRAYRVFADSSLDWGQEPLPVAAVREDRSLVVNPGPIPVTGRILVNVNRYHDVFSRGAPHAWLRGLPVVRVYNGVWLELDGAGAVDAATPLLTALTRGDVRTVERLLEADAAVSLGVRKTAYRWLALEYARGAAPDRARSALGMARVLDLAEAHGLDPDVAYGACLELGRQEPDNPVARNNAGVAVYLEGELEDAAAHFEAAIRLRPRMPGPYANLAIVHGERARRAARQEPPARATAAAAWRRAREWQRTFESVVTHSASKPFQPYRVYYGRERIMLGDVLELWPRYTLAQLEAEVRWSGGRPDVGAAAARVRNYLEANRIVEAQLALAEAAQVLPIHALSQPAERVAAAMAELRRTGRVSD